MAFEAVARSTLSGSSGNSRNQCLRMWATTSGTLDGLATTSALEGLETAPRVAVTFVRRLFRITLRVYHRLRERDLCHISISDSHLV